jgi:hypothetical protein
VLRTLEMMQSNDHLEIAGHPELDFELSSYRDSNGRQRPAYRMAAHKVRELEPGGVMKGACVSRCASPGRFPTDGFHGGFQRK